MIKDSEASVGTPETEIRKQFWEAQFKQECKYDCDRCVIRAQAVAAVKRSRTYEELMALLPHTRTCDVVVTYAVPYWWNPFLGRFVFMIVTDKGHCEFFKVYRMNFGKSIMDRVQIGDGIATPFPAKLK